MALTQGIMSPLEHTHVFAASVPPVWRRRVATAASEATARLAQWGAWSEPVTLHWLEDRAALHPHQPAPLAVRALATATEVRVWAPWRWPEPPDDRALQRLVGHELAHAWWLQRTQCTHNTKLPLWLAEGWGVLLQPSGLLALPVALPVQQRLALAEGGVEALARQPDEVYALAEALCARLVARLGRRGLTALQRGLQAGLDHRAALQQAGLADPDQWLRAALVQP